MPSIKYVLVGHHKNPPLPVPASQRSRASRSATVFAHMFYLFANTNAAKSVRVGQPGRVYSLAGMLRILAGDDGGDVMR